ncbi:receptor-like serine/threonine-protein kinase SD1-8 [Panicum miliaceum]|uniref:Receptor-like serine/threonine-protein kinase SD1-8 n=1 Tax=Panicum miliaceum TaxID=4540 RepID=A0A3L6QZR0_PANMI|nr:receptor-like serine/threonine-protein kinase SD1-8 [Panicum miliaceum]
MRQYPIVVQDVYIRLAQSDIDALNAAADNHQRSHKGRLIIIVAATASGVLLLLAAVGCCCFWMKKERKKRDSDGMRSVQQSTTATGDFALPYRPRSYPSLSPARGQQQPDEVSGETRYAEKPSIVRSGGDPGRHGQLRGAQEDWSRWIWPCLHGSS